MVKSGLLMRRSRHSALLRLLAFVLLLWIGFDFGAHGLFVCDFGAMPSASASARLGADDDAAPTAPAPDHCFCHSLSVGAVAAVPVGILTLLGSAVTPLPMTVAPTDRHPVDQPPRHTA